MAAAYLGVVALSETRLRLFGARALESAALRAAGWRGQTLAFPGLEAPAPGPVPAGPGQPACPGAPTPGPSTPGPSSPGPAVTVPAADRARGRLIPAAACRPRHAAPAARVGRGPGRRPPQAGRVSACSMVAAAASRLPSAPIRSAQGHQNHQLPSRPREA